MTNKNFQSIKQNNEPELLWSGGSGFVVDGVEPDNGISGQYFTFGMKYNDMDNDLTPTFTIFLPEDNPVELLGDGDVPIDLLQILVTCKRREVIVHFDEDESQNLVAQKVVVINETVRGTVLRKSNLDERKLLIEVDDGSTVTVKVRQGAFFYKQGEPDDDGDFSVGFGDIEVGDNLNISGLSACDAPPNPYDDVEFIAFAVVILSPTIAF